MITRGRRSFLAGAAGLTLALPMLEWNQRSVRAAGTPAKRLIVMFSHGGNISCRARNGSKEDGQGNHHGWDLWAPPTESTTLSALGEEMSPLESHVDDLILLRGVDNLAGCAADYGGGHGTSNVTAMTAADFDTSGDDALPLGPSLDQVLAERLAVKSPVVFPSIDLAINGHNYGTPFFRAAMESVSSERNPALAYSQIFGGISPSNEPNPELVRIRAQRRSVLDGVLGGFDSLTKRVGQADKLRLESHAEHIRGMEQTLDALDDLAACTLPDATGAVDDEWYGEEAEQVGPLMVDFILHSMRCGLTNVATLQIGDLLTRWLPSPHDTDLGHSLGHTARDIGDTGPDHSIAADWRTTITNNRQWRMGLFARLIAGLKETPESGGSMLDHSVLMFTSEFSCSSVHTVRDVPMLLAGRAGNRWTTGRHYNFNKSSPTGYDYETDVSTHNVFTSVLNAFDFDDAHFGNDLAIKTGPLSELG